MINDEAAFVDFFGVDSVLGIELEITVCGGNREEWSDRLGLENSEALNDVLFPDFDSLKVSNAEVSGFDIRVAGLRVEAGGDFDSLLEESGLSIEDCFDRLIHLVLSE